MRTRVMIGGVHSAGEVRAAVAAGADAAGLGGPSPIGAHAPSGAQLADAAGACPPGVSAVLVTAHTDARSVLDDARAAGVGAVQLSRQADPSVHAQLREAAPWLRRIQAIDVDEPHAGELARAYGRLTDALLLDSGRSHVTVAELGGAHRAPDWSAARRIVHDCPAPVWLACGLTPASVGEAIEQVNPFGVEVSAGVRTGGRLDARKLSAFFHDVRTAKGG